MKEDIISERRLPLRLRSLRPNVCRTRSSVKCCRIGRRRRINEPILIKGRQLALRDTASRTSNVFIIRLRDGVKIYHAIVIDADNGIIMNYEEAEALVLPDKTLPGCEETP